MPVNPIAGQQIFTPVGSVVTLHSFTTAGSGAGGTATSTTQADLAQYQHLDVFVDVTFSQGAATNTLLMFVDGRPDGTNFISIAHFADITTAGRHFVHLGKTQANALVAAAEADAGAGTVRSIGFGDAIRVRRQIIGTATTQFSATVYITNLVQ